MVHEKTRPRGRDGVPVTGIALLATAAIVLPCSAYTHGVTFRPRRCNNWRCVGVYTNEGARPQRLRPNPSEARSEHVSHGRYP